MSPTHGAALLDVRVEARPAQAIVAVELRLRARTDREGPQQEIERLADRVGVRVGTEVADALALLAAHHHRPRPLLVEGDGEVRIRLVVLQADVEPGPVPLDEVELEEERLDLVLGDDPFDRVRGGHHLPGSLGEELGLEEVVREPAAEALRLPDVDDPALGVEELVRAGCVGESNRSRGGQPCLHCRGPVRPSGARVRPFVEIGRSRRSGTSVGVRRDESSDESPQRIWG